MSPDTSLSPQQVDGAPGIETGAVSGTTPTRRRVIATGSVAVLGAMGLAACGSDDDSASTTSSGGAEGSAPSASAGGGSGDTVVALADVPVGGAVAAEAGGQSLVVAQPESGTVVAYSSVCPHQGCKVAPAGTEFKCPCHASTFTYADGSVTGGPAGKGLTKVDVAVDGDNVVLG